MITIPIWLLVTLCVSILLVSTMLWTNLRERTFRVTVPDID